MNKKGFTLVELLAAVTILALLALITVPAVTRPVKESKQDLYNSQLRSFKESAKSWGAEKMFSVLPNYDESNKCLLVPLQILVDDGLVDSSTKSPLNGKVFTSTVSGDVINGVFVKIENTGTVGNKYDYTVYECNESCYNPDSEEDQDYNTIAKDGSGNSCVIYKK